MPGYAPLKYTGQQHTPMVAGDFVSPAYIQQSARAGNQLQSLTDGLYVGTVPALPVIYVSTTGTDATTSGTLAVPYKTIDYALSQLVNSLGLISSTVTILLKAGETFPLLNSYNTSGNITFAFYGSNFGDYNSPLVGGTCSPAYIATLNRPAITSQPIVASATASCTGFRMSGGSITFQGVYINLATTPSGTVPDSQYALNCDFVSSQNNFTNRVILDGAIINATATTSMFGFLGVLARSQCHLTQYASQFRVINTVMDSSGPPSYLVNRKYFLKMYADFIGNNQTRGFVVSTTSNSSAGSGFLNLIWTQTQALAVTSSVNNQASFPTLADANYGFKNYISGLLRDQQSRPTNVVCPILF